MKININNFNLCFIFAVVILSSTHVFAQVNDVISLSSLIAEAKHNNPQIQEAFQEWKAAEYKARHVKSWDDPMVRYTHFGEEVQTRVGPQEYKIGVSQKIPFPGKLSLKGKAQSKQADMLHEKYFVVHNNILQQVQTIFYDLYWVDRALEITDEEKSIFEKMEKVAQRKYESNLMPQQNVIKIQVELSKTIQKIFYLKQNRSSLNAKLNHLLNRQQDDQLPMIRSIDERDFNISLKDVLLQTKMKSQQLLVANLNIEKAQHEKTLANMTYWPDMTFGMEYIEIGSGTTSSIDDGQDAWMASIAINIPFWFGKKQAERKEKQAALEAVKQHKSSVENQVIYEAQDVYFKIHAYKDTVLLFETALLPQVQQAFESSQSGFETNSISFLDWLDAERTYLQTRLAYYKAKTDYYKAIASLEEIMGGNLEGVDHEE